MSKNKKSERILGKATNKSGLRGQIEKVEYEPEVDTVDPQPVDFVAPLLKEVMNQEPLPEFSLQTEGSSKEAVQKLSSRIEIIENQLKRVRQLRSVLEEQKYKLESQDDPTEQ